MNVTEPQSYQVFESLPARMVGVIRSPKALFKYVIGRPRWAAVLLVTLLVTAAAGAALMETEVGRQALVDQWERTALAFGREVDDTRYEELERMSENGAAYAALNALAAGPGLALVVSAAIFGVFRLRAARSGGQVRADSKNVQYGQVLAVTAHAGVILALRQLVMAPLNYVRETLASPTTLGLFLPMLDEASPAARFFGVIDFFVLWWVLVLAIGVSLLYGRSTPRVAVAFIGAYVGFAALLAIAMAVSGGTV